MTTSALALLLADSRLPTGAHAHSNGTEQAVDEGVVHDPASLSDWLSARLSTSIRLDAHGAALACSLAGGGAAPGAYLELADELDARMPSPASRAASRRQGEQFRRTAAQVLCSAALDRLGEAGAPHLATAVGVAASSAGLGPADAAVLVTHQGLASAASAALRLLGLDPVGVARLVADLAPACELLALEAEAATALGAAGLPARAAPELDRLLEIHDERKERLFAS